MRTGLTVATADMGTYPAHKDARRYTRELTFGIYDPLLGGIAHA